MPRQEERSHFEVASPREMTRQVLGRGAALSRGALPRDGNRRQCDWERVRIKKKTCRGELVRGGVFGKKHTP